MRVGVIGSRNHPNISVARDFVDTLHDRYGFDVTIVSGGAKGIDTAAEERAMELGLHVVSFRPFKIAEGQYVVQEWQLNPPEGSSYTDLLGGPHPDFADFKSVVLYRDMLIAEVSEQLVAFRWQNSPGTSLTCEFFEWEGKTPFIYDYPEEEDNEPLA